MSLDERDAFAKFVVGRVYTIRGDYETAIAELESALELNPNLAPAYYGLGFALCWFGKAREALPYFQKAIRQSPHDPLLWAMEMMTGASHGMLDEFDAALAWLRKAARHAIGGFWPHTLLAWVFVELDRLDEARGALDAAFKERPDLSKAAVTAMFSQLTPAYRDRILDALDKVGLPE